ncbi:MAG: hypothetical protein IPJ76_02735 [Flavobacteriales bacterium]|nr:MAG: hypothetical protein IPJ76_02735 [Flavobacteriales bacterium]
MTPKRAILILGIVAASVGGWYAYREYNRGVESTAEESAAATLNAEQLVADFVADENAANTKYVGKVVEVVGTVKSIEGNIVYLGVGAADDVVVCTFTSTPMTRVATPVRIRGEVSGAKELLGIEVELSRCAIVE